MGAIFRNIGDMLEITPTAKIDAGTVVQVNSRLIGVAPTTIPANSTGYINTRGEYDVDITAGTASDAGAFIECAAKTLGGVAATVEFGPLVRATAATDTVARAILVSVKPPAAQAAAQAEGGGGGT